MMKSNGYTGNSRHAKVVILDNGHGKNTPGKCSPDKSFYEWRWTRMFVNRLKYELEELGYIVIVLVPEEIDLGLTARATRANKIIEKYGASNCIFVSIHNNAAGSNDSWYNATGWEVYTTVGQNNSDKLAECLATEAELEGLKLRSDVLDGDKDREKNFTVIYKTNCPAVITENMFMDSKKDLEFLKSDEGIRKLLNLHVAGIHKYFNGPVSRINE